MLPTLPPGLPQQQQQHQTQSQLGPIGSSILNAANSSNATGLNLLNSSSSSSNHFQPQSLSLNSFNLSSSSLIDQSSVSALSSLTSQLSQSLIMNDDQLQLQLQLQQQLLLQQQQLQLQQQLQQQQAVNQTQAQNSQLTPTAAGGQTGIALQFMPPPRPSIGTEGKSIKLRANHFTIQIPKGFIFHYTVRIQPDKCPKRINRDILNTLVQAKPQLFSNQRPVFDGKKICTLRSI